MSGEVEIEEQTLLAEQLRKKRGFMYGQLMLRFPAGPVLQTMSALVTGKSSADAGMQQPAGLLTYMTTYD